MAPTTSVPGFIPALDDFGAGYSSLSYRHCFPFGRIKIGRSLVTNMTTRREAFFIVRAVIGLCCDLGVQTTVEGWRPSNSSPSRPAKTAGCVQGHTAVGAAAD